MTTLNSYATLADYKAWIAVRGLAGSIGTDSSDDTAIELILKSVSRYIDTMTGRQFMPYIETRYYDTPINSLMLRVDDDLLEVISITNGDATTLASTEYELIPRNRSPHYGIKIDDTSIYYWTTNSAGGVDGAIAVTGIWGYHSRYSQAWALGSTANEGMDASETGFDVTSGTNFAIGQLIKFDNELGYVSNVSSNTLTITRGENYSTAATHLTAINVYIWQVMDDIKTSCLQIAQNVYAERSGQSSSGKITITASGIVIRPEEVPPLVQANLMSYRNVL